MLRAARPPCGFLNVLKPVGVTSRRALDVVQQSLGLKDGVGHGGTLDPSASGVLPLAVGKASKLLPYLADDKEYRATFKLGVATSSGDFGDRGGVATISPQAQTDRNAVEAALQQLVGEIRQSPPSASAIRIDGTRAYELVQKHGHEHVQQLIDDKKARTVRIDSIRTDGWCGYEACDYPELTATIRCRDGTYIRSLAVDLGRMVSARRDNAEPVPTALSALVRTRSSGFKYENAAPLSSFLSGPRTLLPCDAPLLHLPGVLLGPPTERAVVPRLADLAVDGAPPARGMIHTGYTDLRSTLNRWQRPHKTSWALMLPGLGSPAQPRPAVLQQMVEACMDQRGSDKAGLPSCPEASVPRKDELAGAVRVYLVARREAAAMCGLIKNAHRSALPYASALELLGYRAKSASDYFNAPVLVFLGVAKVQYVHRVYGGQDQDLKRKGTYVKGNGPISQQLQLQPQQELRHTGLNAIQLDIRPAVSIYEQDALPGQKEEPGQEADRPGSSFDEPGPGQAVVPLPDVGMLQAIADSKDVRELQASLAVIVTVDRASCSVTVRGDSAASVSTAVSSLQAMVMGLQRCGTAHCNSWAMPGTDRCSQCEPKVAAAKPQG